MKNSCAAIGIFALASAAFPNAILAELVHISTPSTSMVLDATEGKPLQFLYYGDAIADAEPPRNRKLRLCKARCLSRIWHGARQRDCHERHSP